MVIKKGATTSNQIQQKPERGEIDGRIRERGGGRSNGVERKEGI